MRSCPVEDAPAVYAWLWRTMDNVLVDRLRLLTREAPTAEPDCGSVHAAVGASPERELERTEERRELAGLFEAVAAELAPRQRAVLGLYARGLKRPQLARELQVSQRVVKRDLERILAQARARLVERCGGGCLEESRTVWRFAFGLANSREAAQAQLHLMSCASCQAFLKRLGSWREAAAAAVPIPAAEHAHQGVLERCAQGLTDMAEAAKARISGSGSSVRQHLVDGGAQLKQQSASVYARAVDPTPLAGMRPGAAAAAIGTCLALGAGATYCVDQGVAPLPNVAQLLQHHDAPKEPRKGAAHRTAQVDPPPTHPQPPAPVPAPAPEPTQSAPQPVAQATPTPPPPAPEQEQFDPAAAAAAEPEQQPTASAAAPAAAPKTGVGEFLGGP